MDYVLAKCPLKVENCVSVNHVTIQSETYDPWIHAKSIPNLIVCFHEIAKIGGGGLCLTSGALSIIALEPDLSASLQRVYLTHELVHLERNHIQNSNRQWELVNDFHVMEERIVHLIASKRLVACHRPSEFDALSICPK